MFLLKYGFFFPKIIKIGVKQQEIISGENLCIYVLSSVKVNTEK